MPAPAPRSYPASSPRASTRARCSSPRASIPASSGAGRPMAELTVELVRPAQGPGQPVIELTGAGKTYRTGALEFEALREIDLRIDEGEYVAVMGPSGSGKSTLMNLIGCLDTLTVGGYRIAGDDVAGDPVATGREGVEAADQVHQGRLAGARRAHHRDVLPLVDPQVDLAQRLELQRAGAVGLPRAGQLDHWLTGALGGTHELDGQLSHWSARPRTGWDRSPRGAASGSGRSPRGAGRVRPRCRCRHPGWSASPRRPAPRRPRPGRR